MTDIFLLILDHNLGLCALFAVNLKSSLLPTLQCVPMKRSLYVCVVGDLGTLRSHTWKLKILWMKDSGLGRIQRILDTVTVYRWDSMTWHPWNGAFKISFLDIEKHPASVLDTCQSFNRHAPTFLYSALISVSSERKTCVNVICIKHWTIWLAGFT